MKKSIFIVSFVILSLIFSYSFVMATDDGNNVANGIKNTVNNAENMAEDAGKNVGGAIKNGAEDAGNTVKDSAQKAGDSLQNGAENVGYTATRTATEQNTGNTTQGWMNRDIWTWIIVGIITIVIVALIWYYASRSNH